MSAKDKIDKSNIPEHVAIIMDGNGRWAKRQGEMRIFGHSSGVESVRDSLIGARELGVKYLTLYAFSTENWNRPKDEVDALMDLLVQTIVAETKSLNENKVRLKAIGDIESLPESCRSALKQAIEDTSENYEITLILALSYSSRWEILNAVKKLAKEISSEKLTEGDITEELFSSYLTTNNIPDPDILIRTSGEERISNFLLWQIAYTELVFTDVLWPEFRKEDFFEAVLNYQRRERRFGRVSEQISSEESL